MPLASCRGMSIANVLAPKPVCFRGTQMIAKDFSGTSSPAPRAALGDLDSASHSVQLYEDDAVLLDSLSHFIGSALGGGAASVVIATQSHRDGLAERLRAHGLDVDLAISQRRY